MRRSIPLLVVASILLMATETMAQYGYRGGYTPYSARMQIKLKGVFGLGGEYTIEGKTANGTTKYKVDAEPSLGVALSFEYPIHRFFMMGLGFGYNSVNDKNSDRRAIDRSHAIDVHAMLRARMPFYREAMEFYISLPMGIAIFVPSSDVEQANNMDGSAGVGFSMMALAGFQWHFYRSVGTFIEIGASFRQLNLRGTSRTNALGKIESDSSVAQFQINFGTVWTF